MTIGIFKVSRIHFALHWWGYVHLREGILYRRRLYSGNRLALDGYALLTISKGNVWSAKEVVFRDRYSLDLWLTDRYLRFELIVWNWILSWWGLRIEKWTVVKLDK
jgi:hypothetical protein